LSKYVDGILGRPTDKNRKDEHALVGKNLGQCMQWDDDMEYKGNKMWKAFHCSKSKASGIGLGCKAICAAVVGGNVPQRAGVWSHLALHSGPDFQKKFAKIFFSQKYVAKNFHIAMSSLR
jgi:hypothetical protein